MNDLMTKSFTSYVDLKKAAMKDLEAGPDHSVEMASSGNQMDKNMTLFLEEAEKVKAEMGSITDLLGSLQQFNDESKSLHKPDALKLLRNQINSDIVAVLKKAKGIKTQLEEMDRANEANRRLSGCKEGTPIYRTRIAVTNGLRKKLKELMVDFQGLRQKMMTEYKDTVGRRYYTVTGEYPDEEVIDKIISDGHGGEEFLSRAIQEHGRGKVLETVVEIQDRYGAAKEIEKSLLELHQVFLDMYYTVTGEYPDEEVIDKIISDGHGGEEFLSRAIQEHGRGKVLETVVEIQDRYGAAKEIEKSLLELHQVFLDMAVMVETQGEQMDDIEHHVMNASHYVKDGTKNLSTAKKFQKSSRKWMCIGLIILLILILVIVIPIATSITSS